jgi:2-polyprenyl-6-methoxyphenol hydroxylase-like FAD-dependent oxidoreductase
MQGSVLVDFDMAGWSRTKVGFGFMRVLRTDLLDVLLKATQKYNIPVHFGKRMTNITENEDGVEVTFSDGTAVSADMHLGCDGIHSAVRSLHIDPAVKPVYSGISNIFTILPTSSLSGGNGAIPPALHATLTPVGLLGIMPCTTSGNQLYWFYSREVPIPGGESNREGWEEFGRKAVDGFKENVLQAIRSASGDWSDLLREIVNKTDTIKFYPIYKMPTATTWSTKRCLLMGDAAHAMQPHAGQGTSMALEDVFLLSRLLDDSTRPLTELFRDYETIRRPRVEAITRLSSENGEIRKDVSPIGLRLKQIAIGVGFWLYKMAGLQNWGIGMQQKEFVYDIMDELIPPKIADN